MLRLFSLFVVLLASWPALAQSWKPYHELGDLYPSYAIAVANLVPDGDKRAYSLGDPNGFMGITLTTSQPNTKVRLELRCDDVLNLFAPVVLEVTAPEAGQEYLITPLIPFSPSRLATLRQATTTYVTYNVIINDQPQPPRTERLRVRSINDCPFAVVSDDDELAIDFMFAAYVNEDHPWIQELLQEALRKKYVDAFVGYQAGPSAVYRQVAAIWRVLQERGIRYSSSPAVVPVQHGVASQPVRLIDDMAQYTQANCADGCVLLASVLRRVGLNPTLVVVPGHMFLGFDLDDDGEQQAYLETTLLGADTRRTAIQNKALYKTLLNGQTTLGAQLAMKSFVAAVETGNRTFVSHQDAIENEEIGYALVDIGVARAAGIVPITYVAPK
ncbi:hypothetical protein GGR92_001902 [Spirosoma lacussanchae]|uniref:hypothetical protein n=1 Tax=Spirosoma lacussanchae TaxID=1884249 RepID=UPI0011093779|nr:hypothetical protein [Spirosoma lacussanchae]